MSKITKSPWTDPDPQPHDFDDFLQTIGPRAIERHKGDPNATVTIVVNVHGEDATRLQRIAGERGQPVDEVISDLLRTAKPRAA